MTTITHHHSPAATGHSLGIVDLLVRLIRAPFAGPPILDPVRSDAAAVRRLADRQRQWSPSFAADLYAAADRHEVLNER